jgi:MscS family membrane protein
MLKEVLDRTEVPPDNEIADDTEVSDGSVTRWTIPDTRITIARIEDGPRAGEFLFSSDTVQRLHRLYRHVKHLPYKPGAPIGLYEEWVKSDRARIAQSRGSRNRLKPVDTSNPRSTLDGFLESGNLAYKLVNEADAALEATPPTVTREEAREIARTADNLLRRVGNGA